MVFTSLIRVSEKDDVYNPPGFEKIGGSGILFDDAKENCIEEIKQTTIKKQIFLIILDSR